MSDELSEVERRQQQIKLRRAEIYATLAEYKRAFFAEGVERPFVERLELEAEDAKLALEARQIGQLAVQAAVERRRKEKADLFGHLKEVLAERGLSNLLDEAQQRMATKGQT